MEQFLSARFLSGRNANQKVGIVGVTTQKVLEVVGQVGIGSTVFDTLYDLDVRGSANIRDRLYVNGLEISGSGGNSFAGITTFTDTTDNVLGDFNTGAVQIDGGLGVEKNATVGAGLSIGDILYVTGIATFKDRVIFDSTNSIQIPAGTTAERDSVGVAVTGQIRYNTEYSTFEGFGPGGEWGSLGGVRDVDQDTYIVPELSAGSDDDTLFFYTGGNLSGTISSTTGAIFNVDVGIGSTQPTAKLDVDGTLNVTGVATFLSDLDIDASVDIQNDLNVGGITTTGTLYVGTNTVGITTILDEDTLASDSDTALATQQSIKAYVDNLVDAQDLDFAGDTGTGAVDLDDQVFTIQGTANEIETVGSGTTLTIGLPDDVTITSSLTVGSEFETVPGIGVSITNGASETATIYGPSNLIIDPMPIGVGTTSGIVRIRGDLYVDGTEFIVDSSNIQLADFVVGIATTVPNNILLDGAGIGIGTDKTFLYEYNSGTNPSLKSSENLNVAAGKHYQIGETEVLSSTTLGAGVTLSSLTTVGVLTGGTWQATAINDDYIDTIDNADKVSLSALNIDGGPDIGAPIADGDLFIVDDGGAGTNRSADVIGLTTYTFGKVSGDITISSTGTATIQANSVGLGTDTFGQYASTITGGSGLTATAPNADDATAYTIDVGVGTGITVNADDVAIKNAENLTNDTIVKWDDGNGQFVDSIITGTGTSIGISTASPTQTLDVNGNLRLRGELYDNDNVGGSLGEVLISTGSGAVWSPLVGGATTIAAGQNILGIDTTTTYYITASDITNGIATAGFIDSSIVVKDSNVGIGTTNPLAALDVLGHTELDSLNVSGITTTGTLYVGVGATVGITSILDEDDMVSDSDTALATQQSIKAFVSNSNSAIDLNFAGDSGIGTVNLATQTFGIRGTANEIETVGVGTTVTIGLPDVVSIASSLGIGTVTPAYPLDVVGDINSSTDVKINGVSVIDTAAEEALRLAIALG